MRFREVVAGVQDLHFSSKNAGCLFQVASQFNVLEMVSPSVTPEDRVDIYENDRTQGPACAIACGAGTIYRNYFAEVNGMVGQSHNNQIDCLYDLGVELGNDKQQLWEMRNGYALATAEGLARISQRLKAADESERDRLRQLLRIGLQWDTEVTLRRDGQLVSQAYCSALPVAYSSHAGHLWAEFAQLVLEAAYEATICAGILNMAKTGNNRVFLTSLGSGAFGNRDEWIFSAMLRALRLFSDVDLDVSIVSHRASKPHVRQVVKIFAEGRL